MSEFKSQAEVWKALLDGSVIVGLSLRTKYKFIQGGLFCNFGGSWRQTNQDFNDFDCFSIYTEPKKKIVRMAPALCKVDSECKYRVEDYLYASEQDAKKECGNEFIKWLIDTHGVDVEVDE